MRAHNLLEKLEGVRVCEDTPGGLYAEMETTKLMLREACTFDFGSISPPKEHVEFGIDLLSRRMLRLPFPIVLFSCAAGQLLAMAPDAGEINGAMQFAESVGVAGGDFLSKAQSFVNSLTVIRISTDEGGIPAAPACRATAFGRHPDDLECKWWHIAECSKHIPADDSTVEGEACQGIAVVCGLVALLMSKEAEVKHRGPPEVLNKARRRKGKPIIRDTYEIALRFRSGGHQQSGAGTHASPRMHWRRGHYRRLGERLVPVAPCLVNASDGASDLIPNDYVVPTAPGWNLKRH
jgi:hypothetical protein